MLGNQRYGDRVFRKMVQIGAEMVPWFGGRRAEDGRRRETITYQRLPGPSRTLPYAYRDFPWGFPARRQPPAQFELRLSSFAFRVVLYLVDKCREMEVAVVWRVCAP